MIRIHSRSAAVWFLALLMGVTPGACTQRVVIVDRSVTAPATQPEHPGSEPTAAASTETPEQRYQRVAAAMNDLVVGGRVSNVVWGEDGQHVTFSAGGKRQSFDLATKSLGPAASQPARAESRPSRQARRPSRGGQAPARGRQRDREVSPDGQWIAVCRDWNVVIEPDESNTGASTTKITNDGSRKFRFGTASWVYGEELDQRDAMWWSPDSTKLAFYELDERQVPDHYITAGLTDAHTSLLVEGYPKAGEPNPVANLLIYDLATKATTRVKGMDDGEWYTYAVQWSPDGRSLLFNRTNRRQDTLHVMAADPATGDTRIILTEKQSTWQDNRPTMRFLADGQRFIWETERSGWKHYELRNLDGLSINTLTSGEFPVAGIEAIDETSGVLYYMAYSDPTCPLNAQLHRVNLDGTNGKRLTVEPLNHTVQMSPDNRWFITTYEAVDTPPASAVYNTSGERLVTIAESDSSRFAELGLSMPELFTFTADDGKTTLYGSLFKPTNFDPSKKYPLVVDVYGGPASVGLRNRFSPVNPACEYGFLIAHMENRGTVNRGKAFESATYLELGEKDLKDQADGVRSLAQRSYVDGSRVGIFGHSYGGYMAALALLKAPDVFQVGVAGAPVTDWKNYDTIYTERYMRTPQENPDGYKIGSCLEYARNLKGDLLIVHGMVDDNVHPNNTFQLIDILQQADLPFEIMLYPNFDHGVGGNYGALRWRFLREHLVDEPGR